MLNLKKQNWASTGSLLLSIMCALVSFYQQPTRNIPLHLTFIQAYMHSFFPPVVHKQKSTVAQESLDAQGCGDSTTACMHSTVQRNA